ncbi:unnamed protein product [Camellia sinensis]
MENEHFLRTENRMVDFMIRDFPPNFKSYVKNKQLLCQRGILERGWVFWSGEEDPRERPPPPPPPFSEIIDGTLNAPPIPQFMEKIKSHFKWVVFLGGGTQFLIQFWKVIEIEGKRLLTTRHQPFGFSKIDEGLCWYRLISLDYEFDVDGVSDEHLGLLGRVFRHQLLESTPNVQYYSRKEYPQRDRAISCNIKQSLAVPLFEPSTRCCIGVIEMVSTTEITNRNLKIFPYREMLSVLQAKGLRISNCEHSYDRKDKDETLEEIKKMEDVMRSIHHLPLAQTWASCRLCNAVFIIHNGVHNLDDFLDACDLHHLRKGQGVVGRAISSQNLVFCKDVTQFSITEYPLAHYARKLGLTGSFAICLWSNYIEDNVYVLEFFLPPNYCEGGDPRIALVPLLTTMKRHCKSFKVASGEELGEELSIEVLDFSEDGKLYSYQIPETARSPNRMDKGEEMVFLDLSDQQLPKVDVIDTGNNVVTNPEETNIVVTSVQQNCIINLSQRLQRKAGIPISLEDLQQRFGMKLKDAAESLGVSRSTVKRVCREYNITWWSPRKRSKDNQSLSNKLVQGVVQEQILVSSQPQISDPPHMQDMAIASRTKPHFTAAQDTSIVTIKAKYGDDFIKFQLPVLSGMLEFQQQVAKRLNLQGGTYRVKYQDEDNDWILIVCDDDLQNYICNSISQGGNTVTMSIQLITNCPS